MFVTPHPTDDRRAAALWAQYLSRDARGFASILAEADADDELLDLLIAVMRLATTCSPALRHPDVVDALRTTAARLAAEETKPC